MRSGDPQAVERAFRLLAAAPGVRSASDLRAIAAAAKAGSAGTRREALAALTTIGTDDAATEALSLIESMPLSEATVAYGIVAEFPSERIHAALAASFAAETNLALRFAAADALATRGDPSVVPWLESLLRSPPPANVDYADAALGALAKLRHPGALDRIGAAAAGTLSGADARVAAIRRLEAYPLAEKREFLEAAALSVAGNDDDVKLEALDALWRAGQPDMLERLGKLVREGDRGAAFASALVFGRIRRVEAGPALVDAVRRTDLDDEMRALFLRALVLSGAPDTAEFVVRAIAGDHVAYDAPLSLAYNAGAMLSDASASFRAAIAPHLVRALRGEWGALSGAGLVQTIRAAGLCCGADALPALAPFLTHADTIVRMNAALAIGWSAGAAAERDLRAAWWRVGDGESRTAIRTAMERAHYSPVP